MVKEFTLLVSDANHLQQLSHEQRWSWRFLSPNKPQVVRVVFLAVLLGSIFVSKAVISVCAVVDIDTIYIYYE